MQAGGWDGAIAVVVLCSLCLLDSMGLFRPAISFTAYLPLTCLDVRQTCKA